MTDAAEQSSDSVHDAVTQAAFRVVLQEEVLRLLAHMREHGFWFGPSDARYLCYEPTTWDINCGLCGDFADAVAERVPDAEAICAFDPELHTIEVDDEGYESWDHDHDIVLWRGRYYDAECLDGVDRVRDLPIYRNRGRTRTEVLTERGELTSTA